MITKFRVRNYKALRDVTLNLTPIHVLIGPNDSGKTSLLESLGAFGRSVNGFLPSAFRGPWQGRDLVWCRKDKQVELYAEFENGVSYELNCEFQPTGIQAVPKRERTVFDGMSVILPHAHQDATSIARWQQQDQFWCHDNEEVQNAARSIYEQCSGVLDFRWVPAMLGLASALEPSRRFTMEESGFGLATVLDDIIGHSIDLFWKIEERFMSLFPDMMGIRIKTVTGLSRVGDDRLSTTFERVPAKGLFFDTLSVSDLPASEMSDGVLLVLAYLTVLHLPNPPRLLLIEGPENGIHPRRLQDVIAILKELVAQQSHTQVVMTTHSPYLLDMFSPSEVSLCRKEEDGSVTVHPLSESELVRKQLDVFTLGEIWTAEGDEALIGTAEVVP